MQWSPLTLLLSELFADIKEEPAAAETETETETSSATSEINQWDDDRSEWERLETLDIKEKWCWKRFKPEKREDLCMSINYYSYVRVV